MTMTVGTGPLGQAPAGVFNRPMPDLKGLIYFEDFLPRIRGEFAGETVVDSRHAKLLHENGLLPVLYFPEDEVRTELFEPSDKHTKCPWKGEASYWSIRVGDRVSKDAVWYYPEPLEGAPPIKGYVAFYWDRLDRWLEEDEELSVHVRDPYHRVDVLDSSRHVKVSLDGVVLAETDRPKAVYETSLPVRWYIPPEDVRMELLTPTDTQTACPYKGRAGYHSAHVDGKVAEDVVWHYADPRREVEPIRDHLAFYNERVDIEVDGEPQ
jgi:uncharacterized protein (DUF427 family)